MKNKLVVFGSGDMAELAHYYFTNDSDYEVVAFTLDKQYIKENEQLGLPVIPFEDLPKLYPASEHLLFIALSYSKLNKLRKDRYLDGLQKGYEFVSYVSSRATVLNDGAIGENCFILENNVIQPFVKIGNNVTLWSGNHIGHHSTIDDHTFVASHVVISGGVRIGEQCFIGVNATLRDHINVGDRVVLGAGILLLENAENESLSVGNRSVKAKTQSNQIKKINVDEYL